MESSGAETADDLEIVFIGSLYVGPWDKKYWSCSRGKDRYPYPVGYRAIRTHGGNICQMEVREGLKGPIFVITAVDGSSFSGQTPDIAWENFQRSCSKVKNWNGKRFSNKIDGAELFGLKNPSVQRLLRDLVNNVNMRQAGASFSPLFCNGPKNVDQTHQVFDQYPSLSFALKEQDISGKKIRKKRNSSKDIRREARVKKICNNQDFQSDPKICILQQKSYPCLLSPESNVMQLTRKLIVSSHNEDSSNEGIAGHHSTSSNNIISLKQSVIQYQKEVEMVSFANCNRKQATVLMMQGAQEVNCHSNPASNEIPMYLVCSDSVVDKHIVSQQKGDCVETETYMVTSGLDKSNSAINILLDRCLDAEIEPWNSALSVPSRDYGKLMASASSSGVYISDICGPVIGKNCNGPSSAVSEVLISALDHSNDKNGLIAANPLFGTSKCHSLEVASKSELRGLTSTSSQCASEPSHLTPHDLFYPGRIPEDAISQGVAKDSLQEVGSSESSGRGLEEIDLGLAGQELAKSMMAFLLPQAVPLLKKTYQRRRSRTRILKVIDPYCTLTGRNTPDPTAVNDHLSNNIHLGKHGDGTLAQLSENVIQETIDASKALSQATGFTEFNLYLANESFSGNRSSKDPTMAVIPDSFENDICPYDASMKENSRADFNEPDLAPQADMKGNSDTSSLPVTVMEEVNKLSKCFSEYDAYDIEALTPDRKDGLVNSITFIEPTKHIPQAGETKEESIKSVAKYSYHLTEILSSLDDAILIQHFNHESERNAEEGNFQVTPWKGPNKDENFEQNPAAQCHILNNLISNDLSKEVFERLDTFRPIQEKSVGCPVQVVNFGVHINDKGEQISDKENHSFPCKPKFVLGDGGIRIDTIEAQSFNSVLSVQYNPPLSETLLCRNLNNSDASDMSFSRKSIISSENYQSSHLYSRMLPVYEAKVDEPTKKSTNDPNELEFETNWLIPAAAAFQNQDLDKSVTGIIEVTNQPDHSSSCFSKDSMNAISHFSMPGTCSLLHVKEGIAMPGLNREFTHTQVHPSYNELRWNEVNRFMELVGFYLHPEPILSVTLSTKGNQLQLSVLCGFPEEFNRYLFMYSVSLQKQRGYPTFLGYTPLLLPVVRSRWNTNISFERSALQLTPDGQSLIFISSIKAPRCREQKISCLCSNCKSESSKGTTIEIVHVKFGYVSRIIKLTTVGEISCISVCEPIYLIAVNGNGGLHAWVMNLTWSDNLEEFMLPTFDCIPPMILELKGIPNCNSLIIGHNGLGDFGIWELSKRMLLAKFSSPKSTIYQIIPVSWQMNATFSTSPQSTEHILGSMHKTNCKMSLSSFEDIAIWILISAADFETELERKESSTSSIGLWRLALMTKNTIIMGDILDPRAIAVDASADGGIIGTSDGLVYKWDLSSGRKLGYPTSIQCGVSCVALDGKTGASAVADRDGRLHVFIES